MAMSSTSMSKDGTVAIPDEIRHELGIEPGDQFDVDRLGEIIRLRKRPASLADRLFGVARPYAVIPPPAPSEERRWAGRAIAEEVWAELEQQRVESEIGMGRLTVREDEDAS